MRVLAHGAIHKCHLTAAFFELLNEQQLVDILASQAIGSGDDHQIKVGQSDLITQAVKARSLQTCSGLRHHHEIHADPAIPIRAFDYEFVSSRFAVQWFVFGSVAA
jgi:hypothetical protein